MTIWMRINEETAQIVRHDDMTKSIEALETNESRRRTRLREKRDRLGTDNDVKTDDNSQIHLQKMNPENSPLDAARRHVHLVAEHLKLDDSATRNLLFAHEVAVRAPLDGVLHYTDTSGNRLEGLDTPAWLRLIERERPHLLGKGKVQSPPDQRSDRSLSELMAQAKAGDALARSALDTRMRATFGLDDPAAPNMTMTMAAARNGDKDAVARLKNWNLK